MANMRDFNPKAVVVVRKASGLSLNGRRYLQGEAISDDCISLRKRMQLYKQNFLCYPHDLPENAAADAEARENSPSVEGLEGDGSGNEMSEDGIRTNMEANADAEAEASRPEVESDEDETEGSDDEDEAGSPEPVKSSKKKQRRKKK